MGYKINRVYRLKFESDAMAGLEVKVRSMSIGDSLEFAEEAEKIGAAKDVNQIRPVLEKLASAIVSWNVEEDDGTPVPVSVEGVIELELSAVTAIIEAWMEVIGGVPAPLPKDSSGGVTVPMESLALVPMESL